MSVIVRLQNLPWSAAAVDIRQYFHGLSIPEGGVHIVGGELGDAFIAFSTDEDARQAMLRDGGKIKEISVKLYLSSRAEMQKIIDQARQQSLGMQQFMTMPTMPTMPPMSVPSIPPSMPVASVPLPNVPSVPAMQVPLQNVAAMVTNMGKQDPIAINRSGSTVSAVPDHSDNKSVISTTQSVKSDTDKDKKDKRRRRTRSHSRESSNSRTDSRSRSRSRSSSRSRDRKGRDRHYDRRRKRSRSRDRRRRRDRSRSRERSYRDRRKDYNRRDEFDDNNQSRWNNNPAQRNRPNKQKPDFYNRDAQNQNRAPYQSKSSTSKDRSTTESSRNSFENDNTNQTGVNNDGKSPLPSLPQTKGNIRPIPISAPVVSSSGPLPPVSSSSATSVPQSNTNPLNSGHNVQNMSSINQSYGSLPPPPMFSPQNLVSYPNYNPNGMPSFFPPPMPPHQMNPGNMQQDMIRKTEPNKSDFGGSESRNSPLINSTGHDLMANSKKKTDLLQERERSKSRFESIAPSNDIPLPSPSNKMKMNESSLNWGYNERNYPYGNKEATGSQRQEQFSTGWGNVSNNANVGNNTSDNYNKKVINTCVQIKNVPDHTKHDDIREFFRNNKIDAGCLKIVGDEHGRVNIVYVKFNNIGDKKKAICRSGCLLNNSIVTVLHVDDNEFNKAEDMMDVDSLYWNSGNDDMNKVAVKDMGMMNKGNVDFSCIKLQGNIRFHPLYTATNKVHPHIRMVCDKFNPLDVCIFNARGLNTIDAFMKFENNSVVEAVLQFLNSAKVDGNPVVVFACSNDEYLLAKSNSVAIDIHNFMKSAKSQQSIFDKHNVKEDRVDPRLQSSSYSDRRMKSDELEDEDHSFNDDTEMKIEDEPEPEFKRSNKVLLPTPSTMLQMPLQKDFSIQNTNCVIMQNLPLQANDRDILNFFSDAGIVPTQIHIMLDSNGKQYGDAFCEFETNEEAINASTKNNYPMDKNNICVRLVSRQEMSFALGLSVLTPGPNQPTGGQQQGSFFNGPPNMFGGNMRPGGEHPPRMGGGNEWATSFNPGGGSMDTNSNFSSHGDRGFRQGGRGGNRGRGDGDFGNRGNRGRGDNEFGSRGGRGRGDGDYGGRGIRGSRGGDRARGRSDMSRGRGGESGVRGGRGNMRGSDNWGGRGNMDNVGRGGRGVRGNMRGTSRGGRDGNEYPRNQPPDLMSLPNLSPDQMGGPLPSVTRPIQLEENSVLEFGQPGCVVSAENVPYRAELNDILDFFQDFDITAESIIRRYNDSGQVTGDARIAFKTPGEAKKAIKYLNKKSIGGRKVMLTLFK